MSLDATDFRVLCSHTQLNAFLDARAKLLWAVSVLAKITFKTLTTAIQALALQPAVWGISCLVLLPSPCNDSACTYHSAIFVKPHQWPTPSESTAIYCVRKLVSCVTHLQSCAKVDIWNKKKKLRTVAQIKTQDYKNWRLQNFFTIVTPPLNTATTLFNEHRFFLFHMSTFAQDWRCVTHETSFLTQ